VEDCAIRQQGHEARRQHRPHFTQRQRARC
jgi:hypothetical protein